MKRHPFNLVEIALATAVLAVGVSAVLALFPVGASTSRSAVAENAVANIAEYMMSDLQTRILAGWAAAGIRSGFAASCPAFDTSAAPTVPKSDKDFNNSAVSDEQPNLFAHKTDAGLYLYRQRSAEGVVEFEAMVRVGMVNNNANAVRYPGIGSGAGGLASGYSQTAAAGYTNRLSGGSVPDYLTSLVVELSWPIDADWAEREKRLFRFDFFNEKYTPYE